MGKLRASFKTVLFRFWTRFVKKCTYLGENLTFR